MIRTNDEHLTRVLAARRQRGYPDVLQWWASADRRQRVVLARYYQPVRPLLAYSGGRRAAR